jgi:hypothetical protein
MIRQAIIAGSVALSLGLAGCAPPGTGGFVTPTAQSVYQAILNTCAVEVSLPQIQTLITASIPGLTTVATIADAACKAFLAAQAKPSTKLRGAGAPITVLVGGLPITGKFVQ